MNDVSNVCNVTKGSLIRCSLYFTLKTLTHTISTSLLLANIDECEKLFRCIKEFFAIQEPKKVVVG